MKTYKTPFAATGDRIEIPLVEQPDGTVSQPTGWPVDYQLTEGNPQRKTVGRSEMNGVLFDITQALGHIQLNGFGPWSISGSPYALNSMVWHEGKVWQSVSNNNSTTPGSGSSWVEFGVNSLAQKSHTHTIAQITGLQDALNSKQPSLNFTPVNKAGDTMTGNLQVHAAISTTGNLSSSKAMYVGVINPGGLGTYIEPDNLTLGNDLNRYKLVQKGSSLFLERSSIYNEFLGRSITIREDDIVDFQYRPVVSGRGLSFINEAPTSWDSIGSTVLLFNNGTTQILPGTVYSGANLRIANTLGDTGGTVSGSWRCQGYVPGSSAGNERITSWTRVI